MLTSKAHQGFTLIELLVVMVLIGVLVGLVTVSTAATPSRLFRDDAERVAVILSAAREEAQVRSRPIRVEFDARGYRFLERTPDGWIALIGDELLKPRAWRMPVESVFLQSADGAAAVEFGREAIDRPFRLQIKSRDGFQAVVRGDGLGAFDVE